LIPGLCLWLQGPGRNLKKKNKKIGGGKKKKEGDGGGDRILSFLLPPGREGALGGMEEGEPRSATENSTSCTGKQKGRVPGGKNKRKKRKGEREGKIPDHPTKSLPPPPRGAVVGERRGGGKRLGRGGGTGGGRGDKGDCLKVKKTLDYPFREGGKGKRGGERREKEEGKERRETGGRAFRKPFHIFHFPTVSKGGGEKSDEKGGGGVGGGESGRESPLRFSFLSNQSGKRKRRKRTRKRGEEKEREGLGVVFATPRSLRKKKRARKGGRREEKSGRRDRQPLFSREARSKGGEGRKKSSRDT